MERFLLYYSKLDKITQKFADYRVMMERRTFLKNLAYATLLPVGASADNMITLKESVARPISTPVSHTKGLELFLTIDDGWHEQHEIVTMANQYNAPLTMFLIGKALDQNAKVWANAIEKGHELGSHTYAHEKASAVTPKFFAEDLKKYRQCVENRLGKEAFKKITTFRFPYGDAGNKHNKEDIHKILTQEYGWKIAKWNMDLSFRPERPHVRAFKTPQEQFQFFSSNVKDGQIILMHFKRPDSYALEQILRYGTAQKFKFSRISDRLS